MVKDLATDATPSLTCSSKLGFSSAGSAVVVVGAGSPANLQMLALATRSSCQAGSGRRTYLVWHDDQETFSGILVGLKLVIRAVNASAACEKEQ